MARKALRGCGLAAALLLAGHLAQSQSQSPTPAAVQEPPRAAACMACHGPQGNSQISSMPSIAGQPQVFIENQLVLIREGLRDVPAMKGLLEGVQDAEIVQLARFFAAQKPVVDNALRTIPDAGSTRSSCCNRSSSSATTPGRDGTPSWRRRSTASRMTSSRTWRTSWRTTASEAAAAAPAAAAAASRC